MYYKNSFFYFLLFITQFTFAQNLSSPESIEWDEFNNRWLIGNTGNGTIISRSTSNINSAFISGIPSGPYGVEVLGDFVFCCSGGFIRGYNLSTGVNVYNFNLNATFLNGLTSDGNTFLYATDFSAKRIYKIDISNGTFSTIASNMTRTPNGIFYDGENNRCLYVTWGSNAPIMAIDLTTFEITTVLNTTLGNCDGITRDSCGNFYITAWSNNKLNKFNADLTGTFTVVPSTLSNPADIDCRFGTMEDEIGIPNSGNATFISIPNPEATIVIQDGILICTTNFDSYQWFYEGVLIEGATNQSYVPQQNALYYCAVESGNCEVFSNEIVINSLNINGFSVDSSFLFYPNPAQSQLTLKNEMLEASSYKIFNQLGQLVIEANYKNEPISIVSLENGIYFLQLKTKDNIKTFSFVKAN